jgi:hypothetical protein
MKKEDDYIVKDMQPGKAARGRLRGACRHSILRTQLARYEIIAEVSSAEVARWQVSAVFPKIPAHDRRRVDRLRMEAVPDHRR